MGSLSTALASLGLTVAEVSRRSQLPLERVQALMNGASPRLSELRALSTGLRVPKSFFGSKRSSSGQDSLRMLFRSNPQVRDNFDPTADRVATFVAAAKQLLPPAPEPNWMSQFEVTAESFAVAHEMATAFRKQFFASDFASPLLELPAILNQLGGVLISVIQGSRFEGVSLIDDGYIFIFVSPRFQGRMLFTLAHELGHVLAHHVANDGPHFEGASSIGNFSSATRKERFVDAFASCLLLPDEGVFGFLAQSRASLGIALSAPLGDIEILLMARFFGVSFAVAAKRCEDLRLLPVGGSFSMVDHVKKHHKSPERRAAELGLPDRATVEFPLIAPVLAAAIVHSIEQGVVSAGWVADQFDLSVGDIFAFHSAGTQK